MKKDSPSLVIREVQIKAKKGYCYTPTRMAKNDRLTISNVSKDMGPSEPPSTAGASVEQGDHPGKCSGSVT